MTFSEIVTVVSPMLPAQIQNVAAFDRGPVVKKRKQKVIVTVYNVPDNTSLRHVRVTKIDPKKSDLCVIL